MRRLLPLLPALALLVAAPAAHAAAGDLLVKVRAGDAAFGHSLLSGRAPLGFLDANGNGKPDVEPDEPVYLDLDRSGTVNLGDLRLSPYAGLAGGLEIGLPDADLAKPLSTLSGWFSADGEAWVADLDNSGTLSIGDVRLAGTVGAKARPGDGDLGHALRFPGNSLAQGLVGVDDADRNGRRDVGEPIVIDLDAGLAGGNVVSDGDVLFQPRSAAGVASAPSTSPSPSPSPASPASPAGAGAGTVGAAASDDGWRLLDGVLLALAVLNLAGLLFVVRTVNQLRGPPRSPFR